MIPKVNKSVKYLIFSILETEVFEKLNKSRKDFIVSVLWHILSIKGRINFLQLGRFSTLCEQTYRNQFVKKFDFLSLIPGWSIKPFLMKGLWHLILLMNFCIGMQSSLMVWLPVKQKVKTNWIFILMHHWSRYIW